MKQKKMLALTLSQLEQLYRHELPELVSIAVQSDDAEAFKANLAEYIADIRKWTARPVSKFDS